MSWLELSYAHAHVRFEFEPSPEAVEIRYQYRVAGVNELRLALPLLFWAGAQGKVDGAEFSIEEELSNLTVKEEVAVVNPAYDSTTRLSVPDQGHTHMLVPLESVGFYNADARRGKLASLFVLGMVETVLEDPGKNGSGLWQLAVE